MRKLLSSIKNLYAVGQNSEGALFAGGISYPDYGGCSQSWAFK